MSAAVAPRRDVSRHHRFWRNDDWPLVRDIDPLCLAIVYGLLFRFGLLSVAVTLFFYFVLRRFPLTFDFSQWFVWRSIFTVSVLVAIAGYAWLSMNAGRPIFAESDHG